MSRRTRKNIGLVGLGLIGSRVREVLRQKAFQVFVWNRTPRTVPNFVGAPAELAEMCDFIQVFVSDDDALLYVVKQLSPALSARHIVIAHPTVSPQTMVSAAEIVERRGARFLEAPFTGSKEAAENGALVYYIGGDADVLREARPLLEATSKEILDIGDIGQATAIKVATNMVTAATVQAAAEALALVQATGLPSEKFASAMQQNASYSKTLSMKLPKMIEQNFERHFSVQHMLKDMQIASRLGLTHHLELGVTAAARDRLLEQAQRGHGDEDYSAVSRKYAQDAGSRATEAELELFQRRTAHRSSEPKPESAEPAKPTAPAPSPTPVLMSEQPKEVARFAEQMPSAAAETVTAAPEHTTNGEQKIAAAEEKTASMGEPLKTAVENVSGAETALATLHAHVPAAPFLNPVEASESAAGRHDHPQPAVAVHHPDDFVHESSHAIGEEEAPQARGFFSRLLRRANT
jgi:3-hydroxyisobutyrate dehydrogenase-like beta-hydroxyacid dehydrogenase